MQRLSCSKQVHHLLPRTPSYAKKCHGALQRVKLVRSFVKSSIRICRAEIEGMCTANVRAMEGVSLGAASISDVVVVGSTGGVSRGRGGHMKARYVFLVKRVVHVNQDWRCAVAGSSPDCLAKRHCSSELLRARILRKD